ncbi:cell division protein FtsZ-like protein 2-2, chloroplastic-like [Senna tora]|uniref:Cell division protein FtsZ-like protein 2-2, chloroplastic-like n=1 Tax=Senna tora TaxID=362788 RepID=A0A834SGN9_9FABA|nr:cell division protein FtsZ-like protein 2-2, chloroplastic-like [Senna tora]
MQEHNGGTTAREHEETTLITTGFKRQEESEGRPLWASQLTQGDISTGINRRPSCESRRGQDCKNTTTV